MKISCQACHSKYNVADEKIQGKIVKIRCRKCGATIVVNASAGVPANGSAAAPAPVAPPSAGNTASESGDPGEWHVSVSDNDQRTMSLADLVIAYNTGVVTAETFLWTDGMQDWKVLAEVDAVVSALHAAAAGQAAPAAVGGYGLGASAQVAASPSYEPAAPQKAQARPAATHGRAFVAQTAPAVVQEPKRAAVVKREARARDLFATRTGEELHGIAATNEADARLTGQRNENSVLFSLQHLTKSAEERSTQGRSATETDDSGVIDLKALAAKAESMRPVAMPEPNVISPLGFVPSPFGAQLGDHGPLGFETPRSRSKLPLLIAGGVGIALLLVVGIVIGLKLGGVAPGTGTAANVPAFPFPSTMPSATAEPAASASATNQAPSSAPSAAPVAAKTHGFGGGGGAWHGGGAKAAAGGAAAGGGTVSTGAAGGTGAGAAGGAATTGGGAASPAPAKKNDCGCNGDLMCMMKCSTH